MNEKRKKAAARLHGERAKLRKKLAELEESEARYRRLVDELRSSGELFRSIADSATDAIIALDGQGMIHYMNRAAERLFGYTSAEVEGRRLHDFLIPERFREYSLRSFEAMHATRDENLLGSTREFTALTKNGMECPVEVSISSSVLEGATHYVIICRDITERKKVELALRESEEGYRELVENLNDVVFNLDPLGRISYISPVIEQVTSYKVEELVGRSFTHFIHPDDMTEVLEDFKRTLAGRLGPAEFRVMDKDGTSLYVRTSSRPQYKDGELAGLTGVLTDITDQKRAEQEVEGYHANLEDLVEKRTGELRRITDELGRSERYYRAMIENAYDIIAVLDEDGTMRYLSPSMERISGFTMKDRTDKNAFELLHPADLPKVMEAFSKGIRQPGHSDMVEFRWQHKDGTWHWQEAVATNLIDDPVVQGIVVNARDITDRKRIEEALRESEERYRSLIETSPDCIIIVDMQGKIMMVNRSGLKMFRCEAAEDMVGKSVTDFMLEKEWAKARKPMLEQVDFLETPIEFTSVRMDGTRFISESNSSLLKNALGAPIGFLSITRDVTDRRRAEEALRENEEKLQSIFRAAPVGIGLVMPGRILVDVNDHLCQMVGYSREELIGSSTRMLYPSDEDFTFVGREKYRRIEDVGRVAMETLFKRKDGGIIDILLSSSPIDPHDASAGVTFTAMDITDHKRADERLRKLNESFLGLGADPLENMQKLTLTCNDMLNVSLVRYGRREKGVFYIFSSMRADDGFVRQEEADEFICYHVGSTGLTGIITMEDLESGVLERDPDVRRYGLKSALLHPVHLQGEYVGTLCIFAGEIRDFNQVEKDSLATLGRAIGIEEERRAFNESLRDFVDIASHELRHPVALLAGYAETLEKHGAEMDERTRSEVTGAIGHGTDRLNRLVTSLFNISLIERERFFISKRTEDIVSPLEQAVGEMQAREPARRFNLHTSGEVVEGDIDPVRLHSLLIILLDNAVKYSPQDKEIDVSVEATREEALVSVLDRGTGVPAEHREKIFERFHQVEEAQYHSKPGLGLGLYLAGQIVEGHGGRIWYEPREDGGSAFRFTLPLS